MTGKEVGRGITEEGGGNWRRKGRVRPVGII